jgi:ABC-type multidrug transport system ATPase subunit
LRNAPAYEVRNLRKIYDSPRVVANDGIDFVAEPGRAFGLLGPNGAGKSTLVRQLVGLLAPTAGEVRLFGEAVRSGGIGDPRVGRTVAYLPQSAVAFGELKVSEALRWTGMLRGLGKGTAASETDELLDVLGLQGLEDRLLRKLSGGQVRLVQIGMTLVGRLPVLIFDEPTADIDPGLRRRIWELISSRTSAGACVILVTHDVAEAEHALDKVAILDRGRVVADGTPAELKSNLAHRTRIEFVVAESSEISARSIAADIGGDTRVRGRHVSAWVPADLAVRTLEKVMAYAAPETFEDVRLITPTLEDVYLELGGTGMEREPEGSGAEL